MDWVRSSGTRHLFDQKTCEPQKHHSGEHAAEDRGGHGFFGGVFLNEFGDFVDNLKDGARADGKKQNRQCGRWSKAADPCAEDGGRAADESHQREGAQAGTVAQYGRDDAESLRDVLDNEPDHEEGAQRDLAAVLRRTDVETFAHIVDADADRDRECN